MTGTIDAGFLAKVRETAKANPASEFDAKFGAQAIQREIYDDGEKVTFAQRVGVQVELVVGIGDTFEDALGEILKTENDGERSAGR